MRTELQETLLKLVRLGIRTESVSSAMFVVPDSIDWEALQILATEQGLSAIVVDGLEKLPVEQKPPKLVLLQWIGEVLQQESQYAIQEKAAGDMALIFKNNAIRTYVLKGAVVAECYPNPIHRSSSDLDCFLVPDKSDFNAWELGNDLIKAKGFEVESVFYKNSTFFLPELMVENHRFLTPFRGNGRLKQLERWFQSQFKSLRIQEVQEGLRFEGTWLYRPPVLVSALFLIEHAYSHFLHEGLTWRHVLDWMMFSRKHESEIDWNELTVFVDEFGFRKFYDSYERLGRYLLGEIKEEVLTKKDKMMLADVWAPLDLHESDHGLKGKLALAGNTWRARWKYRYFAEISMVKALWIQVKGVLFIKNPTLD